MLFRVVISLHALFVILSVTAFQHDYGSNARPGYMHKYKREISNPKLYNLIEETGEYWFNQAQNTLKEQILKTPTTGFAKNVILFLGDGMSIPTLTAARAYLGQTHNQTGEESKLSFEQFPYVGLSKTYCVNQQVADSACSATAYLCGVKANEATIGVTAAVSRGDCKASQDSSTHLESIARWFQKNGRSAGLVTTTRVTHASPAGLYAHTSHRDWESDSDILKANNNPEQCSDIAYQLVNGVTGQDLKVILGGGRAKFLPKTQNDSEGIRGNRSDGRNLIDEWQHKHEGSKEYIWNRSGLLNISSTTKYLLGLFASEHIPYNLERDKVETPSLSEMTAAAIKVLSKNSKGYFLFVEGGRIDLAHHDNHARRALDETVELHKAVETAVNMTSVKDTLIVVTADHAHTMNINGYPSRGNDILGMGGKAIDGLPFPTLTYSNGPGYRAQENGQRYDISNDNLGDTGYSYPSGFPLVSETHGGDDVGIFSLGPWAHLLVGVLEQNVIPHVMAFASCVGDGETACKKDTSDN